MSNCPTSTACPGATSIVPLTRLVRTTVPAALAKTPSAFPTAMSGTGFAAALQKSVFACGQFFLRDSASGHQLHLLPQDRLSPRSLPGGQAACIHGPDKILRPDQQGNEQQDAHPQPAPPQKGPQSEVQPGAGLNAQPHPPLSGQCRKVSVLPGRAPARKAAGCRGDR